MNYIVGRISGGAKVGPDAGGQGRQRKREGATHKGGGGDSISISDEARRRSDLEDGEPE
ncbi:MAG TPA: hypothetical protein VIK40_02820 [Geomonas sp.]